MPQDPARVVNSLRSRPWRTAAIVAAGALTVGSAAALRRQSLRQDAVRAWAARSSSITRMAASQATGWVVAREGDTRLLATSAGHSPQIFGVAVAGAAPFTQAKLSESLARTLASLNQLHSYTDIWLFDRRGRLVGTTSRSAAPRAIVELAMASLASDSGMVSGPFPRGRNGGFVAFAQKVLYASATDVSSPMTGRIIGSAVLTSDAAPLLAELVSWPVRSTTATTSLVIGSADSVYAFALTPVRARGTLRGAWSSATVPGGERAVFASRADTTATVTASGVAFASRIVGLPWAIARTETADVAFAGIDGRLGTEVSVTVAVLFMIAVIVNARSQADRERELRDIAESETRYRLLADNSTDIIVRHAPDGRIVYISPAVYTILGYQPRQLQGRYPAELFHPDDATTMDVIVQQLGVTTGASRAEHRLRHADGRYVWLETTGRAVRDPVWGTVTELVTVSRDIVARKQAEEALRASEEEYRVLFEGNPLPMWAFDADTSGFVAVNDAAVAHYGYSREEFLRMSIFDIRPAEDAPLVRQRVERVRAGVGELQGARHQRKDGSLMDVDLTVREARLGGRTTWLVLVKDVTEATRAASALRESNEFVRALFESSPVAIIATDLDLRVMQWNDAAERLFGWTAAEGVGKPYPFVSEAMWPEVRRNHDLALRDGRLTNLHLHRCRKDGRPVEVNQSIGVIRNAELQPSGFVLIAADLSEQAKLEAQLRHAQKMDAVGQLAGGVAHDFNNLLTVVTGYAGLLLTELPEGAPMRADVEEIKGAADRAAVLTRQLLAFSRQQVLEPTVLDLNVVVQEMEQMLRRVLPTDIKVVTALDSSLGAVNADPGQLEQVLMNLIVNARDAMPGGGTLTIETMNIAVDTDARNGRPDTPCGDYVMLAVSDTGSGMTKAVQSRVFEPFFTTKERGKGTGLGLSTAHGIITQSGGFLSVYSEPALGTTFKVCLPRVAATVETTAPAVAPTVTHGAEVILLVEDDAAVRNTATRILEGAGYTVLAASDGPQALDIHAKRGSEISLLLTDMIMPEMSGRELVARLRARDPDIAVLVMSGYTEQTSRSQSFVEGGSAFIQKPFTPAGLTAKVRSTITATAGDLVPS